MAFDVSTAKTAKFDISSAYEIDVDNNTVLDKDKVYSLPQTLNADESKFLIEKEVNKKQNFFAMEDVGALDGLVKGVKNYFEVDLPSKLAVLGTEAVELAKQPKVIATSLGAKEITKKLTGVEVTPPLVYPSESFTSNVMINIANAFGLENVKSFSDSLNEKTKQRLAKNGLERPTEGVGAFTYDIGSAASSMLSSIGLGLVTRSPNISAMFFGAVQKASIIEEAKQKGMDIQDRAVLSDLAGIVEGGLEYVGLGAFMKSLKGSSALKRLTEGFVTEALQESTQTAGEEALTQISGIREKNLYDTATDIIYSGMLGGILGGATNVSVGALVKKDAIDNGFTETQAETIKSVYLDNVEQFNTVLQETINKELAPIAEDSALEAQAIDNIKKFVSNQEIINPEALNTEERVQFDSIVSTIDSIVGQKIGSTQVKSSFVNMAVQAGVEQEEAAAVGDIVAARSIAASKALNISPVEWFKSQKLSIKSITDETSQVVSEAALKDLDYFKSDDFLQAQPIDDEFYQKDLTGRTRNEVIGRIENLKGWIDSGDFTDTQNQGMQRELGQLEKLLARDSRENILKQETKGSVKFAQDGQTIITLMQGSDKSTLLHEMAHVFLRDFEKVASITEDQKVLDDWETVKDWLGFEDIMTRTQEETFARGFEQYVREGIAPKPSLQRVFERFREWLKEIYKSAKDLQVEISPEIRAVFARMLDGEASVRASELAQKISSDEEYKKVRTQEKEGTLKQDTLDVFQNIGEITEDIFTPISTRLGNIHHSLKTAARKYVFNLGFYQAEDQKAIKPFLEGLQKLSKEDYKELDLALKNVDSDRVDRIIRQYGLVNEHKKVRLLLDELYKEAKEAGLEIDYIEEYFPRGVDNRKAHKFVSFLKKKEEWSGIKEALRKEDPKGQFTFEEQAEFVNNFLRGYGYDKIGLARPDILKKRQEVNKKRTIAFIDAAMNEYYLDSSQALISYVNGVRKAIEVRKLLGKSEKSIADSIGAHVLDLIDKGLITHKEEENLKKILQALIEPRGTGRFISAMKNIGYIYTMGDISSAITQITDLAFSMYKNGVFETILGLKQSFTKGGLTKQDLGIESILEEFTDQTRLGKALSWNFKASGLNFIDKLGKESNINAAKNKLESLAKKGDKSFLEMLDNVFGEEAQQTLKDLKEGVASKNVKYLLFSELADIQPIALSEMPVGYLRGGNMRVMYMLKTYTVKLLDIYRNDVFKMYKTDKVQAIRNLIRLSTFLLIMGISVDALKDFIFGRAIKINDLFIDNLIKLTGVTKYQIYRSKREGVLNTFFQTLFVPPIFAPFDTLFKDIGKTFEGKKELKDWMTFGKLPLLGRLYYWWFGGGQEKKGEKK